jgi:hypothetical protein
MLNLIGTNSATGVTVTIPAGHQVGDLMVMFAFRDGSATAPTLPSGWTSAGTNSTTQVSSRIAWRVATSSGETSGSWTNATELIVYVIRAADSIGSPITGSGISTTVAYNALTLNDTSKLSWVIGFAGHRSIDTNLQNPPTNMSNEVTLVDATAEVAAHSIKLTDLNWPTTNVSAGGTSSGWVSWTVEVRAMRPTFQNYLHPGARSSNTGIISITEKIR